MLDHRLIQFLDHVWRQATKEARRAGAKDLHAWADYRVREARASIQIANAVRNASLANSKTT